jgi:hypothetical protein
MQRDAMRGCRNGEGLPSVCPSARCCGEDCSVEIAGIYVRFRVFYRDKPIDRGARSIEATERSGGGREERAERY